MLKFLVIEGPAGAGKTYITNYLEENYNLSVARGSLPTRAPQRKDAPYLSAITDYYKALEAARFWKEEGQERIILERFVMSQWVYGALRAGDIYPDLLTHRYQRSIHAFAHGLLLTATKELMWRTFDCERRTPYGFDLHWLVLLPDEAVITERRTRTDRSFAFTPAIEIEEYRLALEILPENLFTRIQGLDDTNAFVEEWMRSKPGE